MKSTRKSKSFWNTGSKPRINFYTRDTKSLRKDAGNKDTAVNGAPRKQVSLKIRGRSSQLRDPSLPRGKEDNGLVHYPNPINPSSPQETPSNIYCAIKKPKWLESVIEPAVKKCGWKDNDLIFIKLEKVEGSPIEWLHSRAYDSLGKDIIINHVLDENKLLKASLELFGFKLEGAGKNLIIKTPTSIGKEV